MVPILNISDAKSRESTHGDYFAARVAPLSQHLGATMIGANVTTVPPGKAAYPFHHHHANEEHFFIVQGTGTLRFGDDAHPVKPGDYIVTPAGGPELAHQLVNTGAEDLVYLALSTMTAPEVVGYPDSAKTGVAAVSFDSGGRPFLVEDKLRNTKGYWDDEDGAKIRALMEKG